MTIPKTFDESFAHVSELATRFKANEGAYLSPKYMEQEVRDQFLNPFFEALGWDIYHKEHPNPYEREVKIEKSVMVGDRGKRADYAFFTKPNFMQARFLAEAKKPARNLENQYDCFQAIRYGWNSNTPIAVLTDFEQFLVLDSRYKPTVDKSLHLILEKFHYSQFADEETFRRLYYLFSREAVAEGSLEKFVTGLKKGKKAKLDAAAPAIGTVQVEPVGDTFLTDLDWHRENLAKAFKRANEGLDGEELTEITQRTLDRLVFIRFLEDKLVEPSEIIDRFGKKSGNAWRDFANEMPRLNSIYNGIIFKPHSILDSSTFQPDEKAFRYTLSWLSHKNSSYDFNSIPIHILGSIYERFLGKTITVTDKRATVEEKPEVRKAGGVYYTPEYIVNYIVENTIGNLIAGRSPDEIATMRFADIACGSGSFLLGTFDYLIKYHVEWYSKSAKRRNGATKKGLVRETADGNLQLTLHHKSDILVDNIYGVDLDAQAVEVAQLSLYLKLLEEETAATVQPKLAGLREQLLPSLGKNIVHGNSLIDWDIQEGQLFENKELRKLNPMNFEQTFPEVFAPKSRSIGSVQPPATAGGSDSGVGDPSVSSPHVSKGSAGSPDNAESTGSVQPPATAGGTDIGGFDAIVGNPPYVFGGNYGIEEIEKGYFRKKYVAGRGKANLFTLLTERALQLLGPNGLTSYIIPNTFLRVTSYSAIRQHVLGSSAIRQVVDLGTGVFKGATTSSIILVLEKSGDGAVNEVEIKLGLNAPGRSVRQSSFQKGSFVISVRQGEGEGEVVEKLKCSGIDLGELCEELIFGVVITKNRDELVFESPFPGGKRFLEGRDIGRYLIHPTEKYLRYEPALLHRPRTPKIFEASEKLLIQRITGGSRPLNAAFDNKQFYNKESINNLILKPDSAYSIKYVLGLFNSRLLSWFYNKEFTNESTLTVNLSKEYLSQLPIRTINFDDPSEKAMHDRVVGLVEQIIGAKKALADARTDKDREFYERFCEKLDRDIDDLVYQLYDITPEERKIIEGIGQSLYI